MYSNEHDIADPSHSAAAQPKAEHEAMQDLPPAREDTADVRGGPLQTSWLPHSARAGGEGGWPAF